MSEVSAWNAVDASNNATPPDGFPEGMQPSAVNDAARMMMGALRREHDRVVAQVGSVAGAISTTTINTTTVNASSTITASGAITGATINSTGNASVAGTLTSTNETVTGTITASQGHIYNLNVDSNVAAGTASITGTLSAGNVSASGNLGATGSVSGSSISSSGNIGANGNISAGGVVYAGNNVNSPLGHFTDCHVDHDLTVGNYLYPTSNGVSYCGLAAFAWLGVESYNFYNASDPALKRDIEPVPLGCLDLVNAIEPKTYKFNLQTEDGAGDRTHWGFLAPEVGEAMQRAGLKFDGVRNDGDAPSSLAYNEMIAVLWRAVQELTQQVETLKQEKTDV